MKNNNQNIEEVKTMPCHAMQDDNMPSGIATNNNTIEVFVAMSFVAVVGFRFFLGLGKEKLLPKISKWRFDMFRLPLLERLVHSKYFPFSIRFIPALLFALIILAGLFGKRHNNIAAPFTWLFWWTALIFFVAFGGKLFCSVLCGGFNNLYCPFFL